MKDLEKLNVEAQNTPQEPGPASAPEQAPGEPAQEDLVSKAVELNEAQEELKKAYTPDKAGSNEEYEQELKRQMTESEVRQREENDPETWRGLAKDLGLAERPVVTQKSEQPAKPEAQPEKAGVQEPKKQEAQQSAGAKTESGGQKSGKEKKAAKRRNNAEIKAIDGQIEEINEKISRMQETAKSQNLPEERTASFFAEKKAEIERLEKRKAELVEELSAIDRAKIARETARADLEKLPADIASAREAKDKKTEARLLKAAEGLVKTVTDGKTNLEKEARARVEKYVQGARELGLKMTIRTQEEGFRVHKERIEKTRQEEAIKRAWYLLGDEEKKKFVTAEKPEGDMEKFRQALVAKRDELARAGLEISANAFCYSLSEGWQMDKIKLVTV